MRTDNENTKRAQEQWRERYIHPLQKMFSGKGVFFTTNIFDMDRELAEACQRRKLPEGSMADMMTTLISKEAADLYRQMLKDPFPWFVK